MPAIQAPELVVPIQAPHVRAALAEARVDQDRFRQIEMGWLEEHDARLMLFFQDNYRNVVKFSGSITEGDAFLAGTMLGHRAVRLYGEQTEDGYAKAAKNLDNNIATVQQQARLLGMSHASGIRWSTEETLSKAYNDEELRAALMDIRHDFSRDAAAVTIGFFCLSEAVLIDALG